MKLCCTDQHLCARHSPPTDRPNAPIYLARGEDVRKNPETGAREIWIPSHEAAKPEPQAPVMQGTPAEVAAVTTTGEVEAKTQPTEEPAWTGTLF